MLKYSSLKRKGGKMNNFEVILRRDGDLANLAAKTVVKIARSNCKGTLRKREVEIIFSNFRTKIKSKKITIPNSNNQLYHCLIRPWYFKCVDRAR